MLATSGQLTIPSRAASVQETPAANLAAPGPPAESVAPAGPTAAVEAAARRVAVSPALSMAAVDPTLPPGPVSVALLLPLSGPSAELGGALLDAAQMALFDIGAERLVLLPKDTKGTPEGASRAAAAALADGASLILGPLFNDSVAAVAPLATAAGVNVIAFSSDRAVAQPGVFIMGFLFEQQLARVVGFAVDNGLGLFAALAPANHYGETVVRELRRVTAATASQLVDIVFYPVDSRDTSEVANIVRAFTNYDARHRALLAQRGWLAKQNNDVSREALRRLERFDTLGGTHFDAVLLPEGDWLLTIAPLLAYYDVDLAEVRLLGTSQWESAALDQEPALVGGWFAAPPLKPRADFEARFEAIYGRSPPRLATLAYDAVALAGTLVQLPGGANFSTEMLTSAGGFRGVDGLFRFAPDGTNQRGLAVIEVTRDGLVTVSAAPESLAGL